MTTLTTIKIGWVKLCDILNLLKDAINARTIIAGPGIEVSESSSGVMVALTTKEKDGLNDNGGWVTIDTMDENCVRQTIQVWARGNPEDPIG